MAHLKIKIDGKEYPYYQVMGALLAYKRETGQEPSSLTADDVEGNVRLVYLITKHACKRDGVEFDFSLEDFADALTADEFVRVIRESNERQEGEQQKN